MLLAQINRDSQGMAEFPGGGGEAQHVTLCLTETVAVADGDNLEAMAGVSLQAVTLTDGTTAYIQHSSKDGKLMEGQVIQLEDGSAAYVQHVSMSKSAADSLHLEEGQAVQLEDGTTAFIHHTSKGFVDMTQHGPCLAHRAFLRGRVVKPESVETLEEYMNKVEEMYHPIPAQWNLVSIEGNEGVGDAGMMSESEHEKKMQLHVTKTPLKQCCIIIDCLQGHGPRVAAKTQQSGEKAFRCDYDGCGKLYTTAHHLKVHERSHTGDRPYQCEHPGCGKAFATGYGLKSHVRTHTGEKPYRCSEENCTKSFKTSGDLQKHIRTHTGERPFKCPVEGCGRSFTTSNIRKVHIRTHTGERPYYCTEPGCGRAFASATNYKNHVRIHTGEKPYVCTVPGCDKRFTEYSSLYKHHVVHSHSKPYNCNHCGKTYKQISTLAMHKRTAHNDTEPIEEEQEAFFDPQPGSDEDILKVPHITYVTGDDGDDGISSQVSTALSQQVALISQDGTQHVNISEADIHAIGNTITMVTQDGTTITVPAHDAVISSAGTHSVAMVATEDTEGQQVAIVAQDLAAFHTTSSELHQQHGHHLATRESRPVTLLATSNGTQIAVQLGEQQSLEEAIRIASRIQQGETPGIDD